MGRDAKGNDIDNDTKPGHNSRQPIGFCCRATEQFELGKRKRRDIEQERERSKARDVVACLLC